MDDSFEIDQPVVSNASMLPEAVDFSVLLSPQRDTVSMHDVVAELDILIRDEDVLLK